MLQVVAWSKMIVDYSAQEGVLEGARKTFDGKHPCSLCTAIVDGKKTESEKDNAPFTKLGKIDLLANFFLPIEKKELIAPTPTDVTEVTGAAFSAHNGGRGESPPVPPPRIA